jgi:hypothetical protein
MTITKYLLFVKNSVRLLFGEHCELPQIQRA